MVRIGEMLVRGHHLSESQLQTALSEQKRWGGHLGEVLLRMDYVSEAVLVDVLSRQLGILPPDPKLLKSPETAAQMRLPYETAKKLRTLPLSLRDQGRVLTVAMVEPQNIVLLDELRKATGCRIQPHLVGPATFIRLLSVHYDTEEFTGGDQGGFRVVDAQGRTVAGDEDAVKNAAGARPPQAAAAPAAERPAPRAPASPAELLARIEQTQRQEVAALRAMVELLIERGVFSREEYLARVRK